MRIGHDMRLESSRRRFLQSVAAGSSIAMLQRSGLAAAPEHPEAPLEEFTYEQVSVRGLTQIAQRDNVSQILMGLDEDSLLKPFREMSGQPAPGVSLGGWYAWKSDYNYHHDDFGLAPGATFGQWTSSLSRLYAGSKFGSSPGRADMAARVERLHSLLADSLTTGFFERTRFPGYTYDKLVCGFMDAHRLVEDGAALDQLEKTTTAALPVLPGHAIDRDVQWKMGADLSWVWDENYTMPENLYLISQQGADPKYRRMAEVYLLDSTFFEPLSREVDVLADKHAYSYVNSLCSAMQAYLIAGSTMHLEAAIHGFSFLQQQSFATGGWGPDEMLRKQGYDELAKSLTVSKNGFETPCGSYAHMKLTRYLLRATRDGQYGDSMERIMLNTVLGALPLEADGRSFYSSDYNYAGKRVYSLHRWPCCSGTFPQVVADYGINGYLREPSAVWINLYQPSELRWFNRTSSVALEQTGVYPEEDTVRFRIVASHPTAFALHFRVPAWATGEVRLTVNQRPQPIVMRRGFTTIERTWRTGDVVELQLPMSLRLEFLPADGTTLHPHTAAVMRGPLVLFPLREPTDKGPLTFTREELLGATRTGPREWTAMSSSGARRMVPFSDVGDREYSTYVNLSK